MCWGRDLAQEEIYKLSKEFRLARIGRWSSPVTKYFKLNGLTYKFADKSKIEHYVVKWEPMLKNFKGNIKDAAYAFECEALNLRSVATRTREGLNKLPFQLGYHFPALRKYLDK